MHYVRYKRKNDLIWDFSAEIEYYDKEKYDKCNVINVRNFYCQDLLIRKTPIHVNPLKV